MRKLLPFIVVVFAATLVLAPLALADAPEATPTPGRPPAPLPPIFPPLSDAPAPESPATSAASPQTLQLLDLTVLTGRIAFSSDRGGDWDVWVMPAQGGLPVNLTQDPGWDLYASWSPDGRYIAFSSTRDAPDPADPEANREIYVMAADGSDDASARSSVAPATSGEGSRANASEVRRLTFHPATDTAPAWSPDGRRIAFVSNRHPYNPDEVADMWEIWAVDIEGGEPVRLTYRNGYATDPAWSPDGRRLAYAFSTRPHWTCTTNWDVYVLDLTTYRELRLTTHCGFDGYPRWSPDGARIAFTRCDASAFCLFSRDNDIWIMRADGTAQVNLTRDASAQDYFPAWSPDGAYIAFASDRDPAGSTYEVYVTDAAGSAIANLTDYPDANDIAPYWAGDPAPTPTPTPPPAGEEPPETVPGLPVRLDDEFYGLDPDPGYKSYAHNPITITVPITRYYGPVDDEGRLLDEAIGRSVAAQAELTVMAFDVDNPVDDASARSSVAPATSGEGSRADAPEVDRVFVNGQLVGQLTGADGAWRPVTFPVEVTALRFPKLSQGGPEVTAANVITITVDEAETGRAVQVAWARLKVPGVRPMVLMAGFDSNPLHNGPTATHTTWRKWVDQFLPDDGLDGFAVNPPRDGHASIADGAWYLDPAAQEQRRRFGVDRVDVVGYSMGGLWAREYAWQRPEVVNGVVMIGTPNGGSLWADLAALARDNPQAWIQTACRLNPNPSCAAVGLAAYAAYALAYEGLRPAIDEITTDFVTSYNRLHPPRLYPPGARYITIGGVVPIPLAPPSDLAVTLDSLQALDYAWNLPPWTDWRANHWNLPQDPYIYRYLQEQGVIARPQPASPFPRSQVGEPVPTLAEPVAPLQGLAPLGTVITAGQTIVLTQTVDAGTVAQFSLSWINPESRLSLGLVDPAGTKIDPGTTMPGVEYFEATSNFVSYHVTHPAPGDWQLVVSAETTPEDGEPFVAGAALQSGLQMTATTNKDWYQPGEPIHLTVTLTDRGQPVTGAEIIVDVTVEHQPVGRALLADDGLMADVRRGDGKYTRALATAAEGGLYTFAVLARGVSPDGLPFSRSARLSVQVSPQTAAILGSPVERANDGDADGVLDELEVTATVVVTRTGRYELVGSLTDVEGRPVAGASTPAELPVGTWQMALRFDGESIARAGLDGPYVLRDLRLLDRSGDFPLQTDFRAAALTTAPYVYAAFQREPVVIVGPTQDEVVDADADGSYEWLRVGVEVSVREAGRYEVSARLTDPDWRTVAVAQEVVELPTGRSVVSLKFPGVAIWRAGTSGPYAVRDVYVARVSEPREYATAGHLLTTAGYTVTDFRPPQRLYLPLILESN